VSKYTNKKLRKAGNMSEEQINKIVDGLPKEKSKYRVEVNRSLCIGAASCVAVAPSTFELDNENIAVIKQGEHDSDETNLLAAQSCPTKAIIITDIETGQQVYPS